MPDGEKLSVTHCRRLWEEGLQVARPKNGGR